MIIDKLPNPTILMRTQVISVSEFYLYLEVQYKFISFTECHSCIDRRLICIVEYIHV
jgi:hypothetical protein